MLPDYSFVFNYFQNKLRDLKDEHMLSTLSNNPCSIKTKDDIKNFVKKIAEDLFEEEDYYFIENENSVNRLDFNYCGQDMFLEIDERFNHIELDFHQTIKFMASLSNKMLASVNPTGTNVAGDIEDMRDAWFKGLPIHIPEVNFRHRHMSGRFFKEDELKSFFIVEGKTSLFDYENDLILGINKFLEEKGSTIRYSPDQIKAYQENHKVIGAFLNGDYCKTIRIEEQRMIVGNGFENQIFLTRYLDRNPKTRVLFKKENDDTGIEVNSFVEFIHTLGKNT
ncbi:hypothetical protein [Neolewinella persica]|uniref:hypothetical protein n=1 Tax=Neolewinella persica TaxID=70998 RepID=UPI000378127E|nr:hypothetical protein [Neolewinella persica]